MTRIEDAVQRLKILECPAGDLEKRMTDILEDYTLVNRQEISVKRDEQFDTDDGAEAYRAQINRPGGDSLVVLAKSGDDDYVAKVVDVYLS